VIRETGKDKTNSTCSTNQ